MHKLIMVLVLGIISSATYAAEVKVTSYIYVNKERRVAEICGTVTGSETPTSFVQITVDHKSNRPAIYNTMAGPAGKFCTIVNTFHGTAVAEVL